LFFVHLFIADDFLAVIKKDETFFATLNFTYKTVSGGMRSKSVFVTYVPDSSSVNAKFLGVTAAGKFYDTLCKFHSFHFRLGCCGLDDLDMETVLQKASKFELD